MKIYVVTINFADGTSKPLFAYEDAAEAISQRKKNQAFVADPKTRIEIEEIMLWTS